VFDLAEITHRVKSFSVHEINRRLGRAGPIWQDERFDRVVRDEGEFLEKWQYIRNNPVKGGLAERPEDYPWLYERERQGGSTGETPVPPTKKNPTPRLEQGIGVIPPDEAGGAGVAGPGAGDLAPGH
jgi:hypothetical protein